MSKPLEVECPCCQSLLVVDAETGAVLEHKVPQKEKETLEQFLEKQKHRASDLDAMFHASQEAEKTRLSRLEEKFEAAKKNKDLKDPPPALLWD
jgi:uncharacterized Zn finger protein (UPF0148 family)